MPVARKFSPLVIVAGLAGAALLPGCSPTIDVRGHVPDPDAVAQIQPGVQSKPQVAELLGTPSAIGTFDDTRWYYISAKTSTLAFFTPKVLEQNVVVVDFDGGGRVIDLRRYELADGLVIDPVTRKTPAPGKELSFIEQLVGNVGRFTNRSGR